VRAQSAIWEEYKREAEQLDERFQAVLDDRKQKRAELVRGRQRSLSSPMFVPPRQPPPPAAPLS
jgi:hypothetical protein